jgi:hypothetical protein
MRCPTWVTAAEIDDWAKSTGARSALPDLVRRLVLATLERENLQSINFPAYVEVQRHSYDGITLTNIVNTHVPQGSCVWELSCEGRPQRKADKDYNDRLKELAGKDVSDVTYFAVTARDWPGAPDWAALRTQDKIFKEVRVYDSSNLEQWLLDTPAVALWLAGLSEPVRGVFDVDGYWRNLIGTLERPLPPGILLTNRERTVKSLSDWVEGNASVLAIRAPSPKEMVAVFVAWVETLPSDRVDSVTSRAIIVDDPTTWQSLATSKQRLILIAGPNLEASPELLAEAKRQGHHVLLFSTFTEPTHSGTIEIEPMRVADLWRALEQAGIDPREAARLAQNSGGSFTVFQRQFAGDVGIAVPAWTTGAAAQNLTPLLLLAAWDQNQKVWDDCRVIEKLAGRAYSEVEAFITSLLREEDPPLRRAANIWEFLSLLDAWTLLQGAITSSQADLFETIIGEVLGEDLPALELAPELRFMAVSKTDRFKFSGVLRRGLAEILSLSSGLASERLVTDHNDFNTRARRTVLRLLPNGCTWKRWASIGDLLPLLAQAAPDEFLKIVREDLNASNPALLELMRQERGDTITGGPYHTGLLWALEALAWSTKFTVAVADLLARLAELDPGGKWGNRPMASLGRLFLSWRPQTMASFDQLLGILRQLSSKRPKVCWKLLLGLLPQYHGSVVDSYKPSPYRSWAAGWTGKVAQDDYWRYISGLVDIALSIANTAGGDYWTELLDRCIALQPGDRARIYERFELIDPATLDDAQRIPIWRALREIVDKHSAFHDAHWALPKEEVERLSKVSDRLAPADEAEIAIPLFSEGNLLYESHDLPFEEREARLSQRQRAAIEKVWEKSGLAGVLAVASKARDGWRVGISLEEAKGEEPQAQVIPHLLCSENKQLESFAGAYAARRIDKSGRDWAEQLPTPEWTKEQIAAFARPMPFDERTWNWVEKAGTVVKKYYWETIGLWRVPNETEQVQAAVRLLIQANRAVGALELIVMALYRKTPVSSTLLCEALEATLAADKTQWRANDSYHVQQLIKRLQDDEQIDEVRLGKLEFGFLYILGEHTLHAKTLQRMLATDPEFFVECLKILYRPRHESEEERDTAPSTEDTNRANLVWRLLKEWRHIPGTQPDGQIVKDALQEWVSVARNAAREIDRIEACDNKIGELFAHTPIDLDGAKPCKAIREVIESCESDRIERGFAIGSYNLRGVVSKVLHEDGAQERELAAMYGRYAKVCEMLWPRTAATLRGLAQTYEDEAKQADEEAKLEP